MLSSSPPLLPSSSSSRVGACRNVLQSIHRSVFSGRQRRKRQRQGVENSLASSTPGYYGVDGEEEDDRNAVEESDPCGMEYSMGTNCAMDFYRAGSSVGSLPFSSPSSWFVSLHQHKEERTGREKAKERRKQKRREARDRASSPISNSVDSHNKKNNLYRRSGCSSDLNCKKSSLIGKGGPQGVEEKAGQEEDARPTLRTLKQRAATAGHIRNPITGAEKGISKQLAAHLQRLQTLPSNAVEDKISVGDNSYYRHNSSSTSSSRQSLTQGEGKKESDTLLPVSPLSIAENEKKRLFRGPDGRLWTYAMLHRQQLLARRPQGRAWTSWKLANLTKGVSKARTLLRYYQDRRHKMASRKEVARGSSSSTPRSQRHLLRLHSSPTGMTRVKAMRMCPEKTVTTEEVGQNISAERQRNALFRRLLQQQRKKKDTSEGTQPIRAGTPETDADASCKTTTEMKRDEGGKKEEARTTFSQPAGEEENTSPASHLSLSAKDSSTQDMRRFSQILKHCECAGRQLLWEVLWKIVEVRHRFLHQRLTFLPSRLSSSSSSPSSPSSSSSPVRSRITTLSSSVLPQSIIEARSFPLFGLVVDVCEGVTLRGGAPSPDGSRRHPPSRRRSEVRRTMKSEEDENVDKRMNRGEGGPKISRGIVAQETSHYVSVALFPDGSGLLPPLSSPSSSTFPLQEAKEKFSFPSYTEDQDGVPSRTPPTPLPVFPPPPARVINVKKIFPSGGPGTLADVCEWVMKTFSSSCGRGRGSYSGGSRSIRKKNHKSDRCKRRRHSRGDRDASSTVLMPSVTLAVVVGEYWEIDTGCCDCRDPLPSPSCLLYDRCL